MCFTPAGNVTLWKPSHHLYQSPFPSQRKAQWHSGAEQHQLAHCTTAWVQAARFMPFGLQLIPQIYRSAGLVLSRADGLSVHPPSTAVPHCFCWVHKHWMPHRKLTPKNPARNSMVMYNKRYVVPGHLTGSTSSSTPSPKLGQHNTSSLPHTGS